MKTATAWENIKNTLGGISMSFPLKDLKTMSETWAETMKCMDRLVVEYGENNDLAVERTPQTLPPPPPLSAKIEKLKR